MGVVLANRYLRMWNTQDFQPRYCRCAGRSLPTVECGRETPEVKAHPLSHKTFQRVVHYLQLNHPNLPLAVPADFRRYFLRSPVGSISVGSLQRTGDVRTQLASLSPVERVPESHVSRHFQ